MDKPIYRLQVSYLGLDGIIKTLELDNSTKIYAGKNRSLVDLTLIVGIESFLSEFSAYKQDTYCNIYFEYYNNGVDTLDPDSGEKSTIDVITKTEIVLTAVTGVVSMHSYTAIANNK